MTDQEIHIQFSRLGKQSNHWKHQCKLMLPEIVKRQIWKKKGYSSLFEYAAKLAGLSRATVNESLWILRKLENKPRLKKVAIDKGLTRVRPIIAIATEENDEELAKKARQMSKASLEQYRKGITPGNKVRISIELNRTLVEKLKKLGDIEETLSKLINAIPIPDESEPEVVRTSSRHIPVRIKRAVLKRTHHQCAYPGCTKKSTSLHHTQRFALEKVHDTKRLHALCTAHERLAHLGLIANEEKDPSQWHIQKDADRNNPKFWIDQLVALYRPG